MPLQPADRDGGEGNVEAQLGGSGLSATRELTAGAAHELSNALTAVLGYAELAQSLATGTDLSGYLDRIAQQAVWAASVVGDLLGGADQALGQVKPVSVNDVVARAVNLRGPGSGTSETELRLDLGAELPVVTGHFYQLVHVVLNLIENARCAAEEYCGAAIAVRTRAARADHQLRVRLEVSANGSGMPDGELRRVFERFLTTQEGGARPKLGLSRSRDIVRVHKGDMWAESCPDGGACFVVELPGAARDDGAPAPAKPVSLVGQQPASVLVVEDNEAVACMLRDVLTEEGHNVALARDCAGAFELLQRQRFDLLVVDCGMRDMSTTDFHTRLSTQFPHLAISVVFTVGEAVPVKTRQFLEGVKASVLVKPFSLAEVKHLIYQKLREGGA
jgi:two-component system cell cycle sensor histidine kinase/response regulator CckA